MPFTPYAARAFTIEDAAHLVRRTSFGATPDEVRALHALGPQGAVAKLLDFPTAELPDNPFEPRDAVNGGGAARLAKQRWLHELVYSPHPFREKLTLTWSNHFVIGTDKVRHASLLRGYLATLRTHGLGKFERLALEVAKTPAMLRYLDNDQNKKGKPNENFSRELLELFTTGIGHYTEQDVREGARAFTGWTFQGGRGNMKQDEDAVFVNNTRQHDDGAKTYLGQTGKWKGEDAIRLACAHPATAEFVGRKLWRAFVSDTPDPAGVSDLVAVWRATDGDLRAVLTALLTSEAFYAPQNRAAIVKGPVDFVVGTLRALGRPKLGDEKRYMAMLNAMSRMGQELLYPPTVEGWKGGREWISDASLLVKIQTAAALSLGNQSVVPAQGAGERAMADLSLALLGREQHPFAAALRGAGLRQQAYLTLISPEYALA